MSNRTRQTHDTKAGDDFDEKWADNGDSTYSPVVARRSHATETNNPVGSSASSVTLQAANLSRRSLTIFNASTQILYVKFGAVATSSDYKFYIAAGGYYEMPGDDIYTGVIDGIWASANGYAHVTEGTA